MSACRHHSRGFTIAEGATTLAAIGVIVAITAGATQMVDATQLQDIAAYVSKVQAATLQFRAIYRAMPGDIYNATQASTAGGLYRIAPERTAGEQTTQKTQSGDGDGQLEFVTSERPENLLFWQHLSLAGLLPGTYDGRTPAPFVWGSGVAPGLPSAATLPGGAFSAFTGIYSPFGTTRAMEVMLRISRVDDANKDGVLSSCSTMSCTAAQMVDTVSNEDRRALLSPRKAQALDFKYDDGKADAGEIRAETGAGATAACTTYSSSDVVLCTLVATIERTIQ